MRDLRPDVDVGHLVGGRGDDLVRVFPEAAPQAAQQVLAVIAVLVEHRDPGLRPVLDDVVAVDVALALEARQVAHRPPVLLVAVRDPRRSGAGEELGDAERVQVAADRERVLGPDGVEDREDLVLLDEAAGLLQRP
ncbi:MAG: hypothetical protein E6G15_04710 [Actinobacteria bacterium]|nr:MAG: hypothetical protein E6G15_04710 [Actinomycetota bacterium]